MLLYPSRTLDRERASSLDRGRSVSLPWRSEAYWNGRNSFRWAPHVAPTLEPAARVRSGRVSVAPVWLFAALGRTGGVIVAAATSDRISALSKSKSTSAASSILTSSVSVVSRASILAGRLRTANGKEAHAGRRKLEVGTGELDCGGLRRGVS
jgi:hypothetical protein